MRAPGRTKGDSRGGTPAWTWALGGGNDGSQDEGRMAAANRQGRRPLLESVI